MDWRGMVRSVVDTVMNYMAAPVNRQGTAGNSRNFGADMAVHFIETVSVPVRLGLFLRFLL